PVRSWPPLASWRFHSPPPPRPARSRGAHEPPSEPAIATQTALKRSPDFPSTLSFHPNLLLLFKYIRLFDHKRPPPGTRHETKPVVIRDAVIFCAFPLSVAFPDGEDWGPIPDPTSGAPHDARPRAPDSRATDRLGQTPFGETSHLGPIPDDRLGPAGPHGAGHRRGAGRQSPRRPGVGRQVQPRWARGPA